MTEPLVPAREAADSPQRGLCTEPSTSRAWWFLGMLAVLRNPPDAPLAPTVIELTIPPGGAPPRHIHGTLDDNFLLLEGEVIVRCGARTIVARPGAYVALPAGVEHTFVVTGPGPARMLLVHASDDFLRFIQAIGTPARELRLPLAGEHEVSREELVRSAAEHDLRIVGPPPAERDARGWLEATRAAP